ncbi:MAG: hypothetical protein HY565_05720 [Candidatus Kerfeldbacteria bacterium]|nr:hypothetical protein [Candidatus Kerfeldbacteria bacterium]
MKPQLLTALAVSTGNILGPLFLFGGIGLWLTKQYDSNTYVIVGIFLAFISSNILIFTTTTKLLKLINRSKS